MLQTGTAVAASYLSVTSVSLCPRLAVPDWSFTVSLPFCCCRLEQRQQQRLSSLQSFNSALTLTAGKLVMFVTFMLALAAGYRVTATMVFTAMMLFETLRVSLSILLPSGLLYIKDMLSTVSRVEVSQSALPL